MYGEDANWGRILAAMGGSGGFFQPERVGIAFQNEKGYLQLMEEGHPIPFDEGKALEAKPGVTDLKSQLPRGRKQEDQTFKVCLGNTGRPCLRTDREG